MTNIDIDALLDEAKMPERTVEVCLRGDLYAEWQRLDAELNDALQRAAAESFTGTSDAAEQYKAAVLDVQERMRAATLTLRLRAIPKDRKDEILVAHPPRDGDRKDANVGFDRDAVNDALIRACCYDPELTDERWAKFSGAITTHQYNAILEAVNALNFDEVEIPFSFAASAKPSDSDAS